MTFRDNVMYRHRRFVDVGFRVVKVLQRTTGATKLEILWYELKNMSALGTDTITIKGEHYNRIVEV